MKQTAIDFKQWNKRPLQGDDGGSVRSSRPCVRETLGEESDEALDAKYPSMSPTDRIRDGEHILSEVNRDSPARRDPTVTDAPSPEQRDSCRIPREAPVVVGSQRIVRNGEKIVTNSDEDEDSSSLEDLDELLGISKKNPVVENAADQPPPSALPTDGDINTGSTRPKRTVGRRATSQAQKFPQGKPEYRYSLSFLAEQRRKFDQSNQAVARANAILDAATQQKLGGSLASRPSEKLLDAFVNDHDDEDGEIERFKKALRRTEALQHQYSWSFFRSGIEEADQIAPTSLDFQDEPFGQRLHDVSMQQQALLGGFVSEYVSKRGLGHRAILSIIKSAFLERREDLRCAYVQVLAETNSQITQILTSEVLREIFQQLGASEEALDLRKEIIPTIPSQSPGHGERGPQLLSFLAFLHAVSDFLDDEVREQALHTVCRLLLDQNIIANCILTRAIETTLTSLIPSYLNHINDAKPQNVIESIRKSLSDDSLRLQLLNHLPVSSFELANFRRRLAIAFLVGNAEDSESLKLDLSRVLDLLQSSRFKANNATDYTKLASLIAILNVALDSGDPPAPFPSRDAELDFNKDVDLVSARLRALSAQIIDTGTQYLGRTEAKEVIDSLLRRLNHAVRSEPPPKQTVLGGGLDVYDSERATMAKWVKSGTTHAVDYEPKQTEQLDS